MARAGLDGIRVLDFSDQIAGPYCSKLFVDAGAEVIKVETNQGDSLRAWTASGGDPGPEGSALFRFLNAGKSSVVGTPGDPEIRGLIADADLVMLFWDSRMVAANNTLANLNKKIVFSSLSF